MFVNGQKVSKELNNNTLVNNRHRFYDAGQISHPQPQHGPPGGTSGEIPAGRPLTETHKGESTRHHEVEFSSAS